jgi:putative membrane protein
VEYIFSSTFFWIIILIWAFATLYNFLGQRTKKETSLDILKKKFTKGEITNEEFEEKKKLLYALLSASFVASIILFLFRNNIL